MNNEKVGLTLDLRGIDMVTPVDLLSDGRTPWSKNFRLYAKQSDDRQVAISSRKGPGYYINPLSENKVSSSENLSEETVEIGVINNVASQLVEIQSEGRINRIDFPVSKNPGASGPLLVSIYTDKDGRPSDLLAQSSINSGDISDELEWATVRFHNAPLVTTGDRFQIVFEIQDDGFGTYNIGVASDGSDAQYSDASFSALEPVDWGLNYRLYLTPDIRCKGAYRFNREDGQNVTLAVYGNTLYQVDYINNQWITIDDTLDPLASEYSFTRADGRVFWVNGFDDLKCWDGTTVETITDTELPILSMITFHKDRLFGVSATDKNRLIWSESPGNPTNAPANEQWYRAYLSTSFWYIPAPKTGSPITGIISFQDSLVIFTQDNKYIFSGYDRGSFYLRQSTGAKGALSMRGITNNENFIYFAADDGLYEFNGSKDTNISEKRIQPLFNGCPNKEAITPIIWKNKVRWYMASSGSPYNDMCALYNPGMDGEWEVDTDTFIDRAVYYDDANDNGELIEFSSHYAIAMLAEAEYHSLGAPIDFEYRLKYDSFDLPAQKKRLRRYYPILQGVDNTFNIQIAMDKDFQDNPRIKDVLLAVNGATWGNFNWGDGTLWGGDKSFKHHRQSYSGSAYYWQLRVIRKGVNNRVAFTGAQYKYRIKRM